MQLDECKNALLNIKVSEQKYKKSHLYSMHLGCDRVL